MLARRRNLGDTLALMPRRHCNIHNFHLRILKEGVQRVVHTGYLVYLSRTLGAFSIQVKTPDEIEIGFAVSGNMRKVDDSPRPNKGNSIVGLGRQFEFVFKFE